MIWLWYLNGQLCEMKSLQSLVLCCYYLGTGHSLCIELPGAVQNAAPGSFGCRSYRCSCKSLD